MFLVQDQVYYVSAPKPVRLTKTRVTIQFIDNWYLTKSVFPNPGPPVSPTLHIFVVALDKNTYVEGLMISERVQSYNTNGVLLRVLEDHGWETPY
jgi:hypothetical protein